MKKSKSPIQTGTSVSDLLNGSNGVDRLFGAAGDDTLFGFGGADFLDGGAGNDFLDGGRGDDFIFGGSGNDVLLGGAGNDVLDSGAGNNVGSIDDTMVGGRGRDIFRFSGQDIDKPADLLIAGVSGTNLPDTVADFELGVDQIALVAADFGIRGPIDFQNTLVANLSGTANVIVLQDSFANGFLAAAAVRDQQNYVGTDDPGSDAGLIVYFNNNQGRFRAFRSQDLDDGGQIDVLANLTGVTLADGPDFKASDFIFV